MRFNELLRTFEGITHATLAKQLKDLERFGVIHRKVYNQIPPKVEYSLTELGQELNPALDCLFAWGDKYISLANKSKGKT